MAALNFLWFLFYPGGLSIEGIGAEQQMWKDAIAADFSALPYLGR
ncbi:MULTISPECIES: hypothetical protein [unclassified Coleofasciculus]|nr:MULTISPECIES: hypothetical protein [unclassified Coleofasciculus]